MATFNVVQKKRRAAIALQKRKVHGEPGSGKLRQRTQPVSISGKRKRKLQQKRRRDQKEAVEKGLITMQDVEMAFSDEKSSGSSKSPVNFPMKKSPKLKFKQLKKKGKNKKKSQKPAGEASVDSMVVE
ncbi:hypothetical protein ABFX02_06G010400 [Erythranthe guttata]